MKAPIRRQMLQRRQEVGPKERAAASGSIFEQASALFEPTRRVLVYLAMDDEIDTGAFFMHCPNACVPKATDGQTMIAVGYGGEMEKSRFGVWEPKSNREVLGVEVAIVPGLAFDQSGNRIGFGAGYYDRYLAAHPRILKIGVCYEFQVVGGISPDKTDVRMDYVVTEQGIYQRGSI